MAWARGGEDDRLFHKSLAASFAISLLLAALLPLIDLPLPGRFVPEEMPTRSMLTSNAPGLSGGINIGTISRNVGGNGNGAGDGGGIHGVQVGRAPPAGRSLPARTKRFKSCSTATRRGSRV